MQLFKNLKYHRVKGLLPKQSDVEVQVPKASLLKLDYYNIIYFFTLTVFQLNKLIDIYDDQQLQNHNT